MPKEVSNNTFWGIVNGLICWNNGILIEVRVPDPSSKEPEKNLKNKTEAPVNLSKSTLMLFKFAEMLVIRRGSLKEIVWFWLPFPLIELLTKTEVIKAAPLPFRTSSNSKG